MITNKKIWVVGFGGIGEAICDKLVANNQVTVITTKKKSNIADNIKNCFINTITDYTEDSIKSVMDAVNSDQLPDYIFITCGRLHDFDNMPEKTITAVNKNWLYTSIDSNVLPMLFFAKYITSKLKKNHNLVMSCLSARIGSIGDNKLGGWYSYRMTKAMLNMLIKNIAIEWNFKSPNSIIFGYHPGTVDTNMTQPFSSFLKPRTVFSPGQAAEYCLNVVENVRSKDSGFLLDWQNQRVEF